MVNIDVPIVGRNNRRALRRSRHIRCNARCLLHPTVAFTLIEMLVVLCIIAVAARWVIPTLPSVGADADQPENQWMGVLRSAQMDAWKSESWIEVIPGPSLQWTRWRWNSTSNSWGRSVWSPPKPLSENALTVQFKTPFPQNHIWVAPQRTIPFVQAVCLSERCVMLAPEGRVLLGGVTDVSNTVP